MNNAISRGLFVNDKTYFWLEERERPCTESTSLPALPAALGPAALGVRWGALRRKKPFVHTCNCLNCKYVSTAAFLQVPAWWYPTFPRLLATPSPGQCWLHAAAPSRRLSLPLSSPKAIFWRQQPWDWVPSGFWGAASTPFIPPPNFHLEAPAVLNTTHPWHGRTTAVPFFSLLSFSSPAESFSLPVLPRCLAPAARSPEHSTTTASVRVPEM